MWTPREVADLVVFRYLMDTWPENVPDKPHNSVVLVHNLHHLVSPEGGNRRCPSVAHGTNVFMHASRHLDSACWCTGITSTIILAINFRWLSDRLVYSTEFVCSAKNRPIRSHSVSLDTCRFGDGLQRPCLATLRLIRPWPQIPFPWSWKDTFSVWSTDGCGHSYTGHFIVLTLHYVSP